MKSLKAVTTNKEIKMPKRRLIHIRATERWSIRGDEISEIFIAWRYFDYGLGYYKTYRKDGPSVSTCAYDKGKWDYRCINDKI